VLGAVAGAMEEGRHREEHAEGTAIDPGNQILAGTGWAFEQRYGRKHGGQYPNPVSNHIGHLLNLFWTIDVCVLLENGV